MLTVLEKAKKNGAKILAVHTFQEPGFVRFKNPQTPRGISGVGTELADLHLPVRINGNLALLQAIGSLLLEWGCADLDFIERHTVGFEDWAKHLGDLDWAAVERATDLSRAQIEEAAGMFRDSSATVLCWAMGITQHRNAVATVKEITQRGPAAGQHRQARCGPVPSARALQSAERPDDGDLGAPAATIPRLDPEGVRLRPAARARAGHRERHPRAARR